MFLEKHKKNIRNLDLKSSAIFTLVPDSTTYIRIIRIEKQAMIVPLSFRFLIQYSKRKYKVTSFPMIVSDCSDTVFILIVDKASNKFYIIILLYFLSLRICSKYIWFTLLAKCVLGRTRRKLRKRFPVTCEISEIFNAIHIDLPQRSRHLHVYL